MGKERSREKREEDRERGIQGRQRGEKERWVKRGVGRKKESLYLLENTMEINSIFLFL